MDFRFPHIERQIYPKTFLKDVHIVFEFNRVSPSDETVEGLRKFFDKHFGLKEVDIEQTKSNGISVFSEDETVRILFGWDKCILIMRTPAYKSFDFAKPFLGIVAEYFNLVGVSELSDVVMWKYNELEYKLDGAGNAALVMRGVFSDALLNANLSDEDERAMRSLTRWEKTVAYENVDDNHSVLTFEFGFKSKKTDQLEGVVTLKTAILSSTDVVAVSDMDMLLHSFNATLDDAFHWGVKDDIINEMKRQK